VGAVTLDHRAIRLATAQRDMEEDGVNKSKARGTHFEVQVLTYLHDCGIEARRMPPAGAKDVGDIHIPTTAPVGRPPAPFVLEVKNVSRGDRAGWQAELETEIVNAGSYWGAVISKRVGKGNAHMAEQWVSMTLAQLAEILGALQE
jgi:hypothetical protein